MRDTRTLLNDAREQLRARLRPLEPEPFAALTNAKHVLADTDMLLLLEHIRLAFAADEAASRARYVAAIAGASGVPNFDALHRDGWFDILFGRVVTPMPVSVAARHAQSVSPGLPALLGERFSVSYDVSAVPSGPRALGHAVDGLRSGTLSSVDIACRTPCWVAARLKER